MRSYSTAKSKSCTYTLHMFPDCPHTVNETQDLDEKRQSSWIPEMMIFSSVERYSSPLLLEMLRQLNYVSDRILSGDLFLYLFLNVDLYEWMFVETVSCCHEREIMDDRTIPLMNGGGSMERVWEVWRSGLIGLLRWFEMAIWRGKHWLAGVRGQVVRFNYTKLLWLVNHIIFLQCQFIVLYRIVNNGT